jgi:hypothetical protein
MYFSEVDMEFEITSAFDEFGTNLGLAVHQANAKGRHCARRDLAERIRDSIEDYETHPLESFIDHAACIVIDINTF